MSWLFHLISNSFCIERSECIMCYITAINFSSLWELCMQTSRKLTNNQGEQSGKSRQKVHAAVRCTYFFFFWPKYTFTLCFCKHIGLLFKQLRCWHRVKYLFLLMKNLFHAKIFIFRNVYHYISKKHFYKHKNAKFSEVSTELFICRLPHLKPF